MRRPIEKDKLKKEGNRKKGRYELATVVQVRYKSWVLGGAG